MLASRNSSPEPLPEIFGSNRISFDRLVLRKLGSVNDLKIYYYGIQMLPNKEWIFNKKIIHFNFVHYKYMKRSIT